MRPFFALFDFFYALLEPFFYLFHIFKLPKIALKMCQIDKKWPIVDKKVSKSFFFIQIFFLLWNIIFIIQDYPRMSLEMHENIGFLSLKLG